MDNEFLDLLMLAAVQVIVGGIIAAAAVIALSL
jgi:hypothetical protein